MELFIGASFLNWATAVLAGATMALVFAAIWAGRTAVRQVKVAASGIDQQIGEQRQVELRRRAYEHLSTFSSQSFAESWTEARRLFAAFARSTSAGEAAWKEMDDARKARATTLVNFYELIATEYNAEWLDRKVANTSFAYVAVTVWEEAQPFIAWLGRSDPAYFDQWRRFYLEHGSSIIGAERESWETPPDHD